MVDMKQQTTNEQLNELSDRGRKKIIDWLFKKGYLRFYDPGNVNSIPQVLDDYLTIGQMIDFLGEHEKLNISWQQGENIMRELITVVSVTFEAKKIIEGDTLCDALWEATKEVLKNE